MDRIGLKTQAKELINGRFLNIFLIMIVAGIAMALVGLIPFFGLVAVFLASGPLLFAYAHIFQNLATKKKTPKFEDLLVGFKDENFTRSFFAYIRFIVFTFLWNLLFVIPGIIKSISYSQMFFLMNDDPDLDAAEAQKKSMELMEGHKMDYFVLQLSFIPWFLLVSVTLGIAAIYVGPYVNTTMALFYNSLVKGQKKSAKATE
ncbi:MAG: DUF975 family protein [Candidatus Saccharibacteria bacterium]|nr:DUF975 family protein [Candidatus Saccharibacteria bacterium]